MIEFPSNGIEYEKFVCELQQNLLDTQAIYTVEAKHDVSLIGISEQAHQIDVYWEYKMGGINHRVAIECKLHKRPVDLGILRNFWGLLDDIPGLRGIVVSPVGFTSGAAKFAKSKGIGLKVIREASPEDFAGRDEIVAIRLQPKIIDVLGVRTVVDLDWLEDNQNPKIRSFLENKEYENMDCRAVSFVDKVSNLKFMSTEIHSLVPQDKTEEEVHLHSIEMEDLYIVYPSGIELRLDFIEVSYCLPPQVQLLTMKETDFSSVLIQDAIEGTLLFVDETGIIHGDLEEEGLNS